MKINLKKLIILFILLFINLGYSLDLTKLDPQLRNYISNDQALSLQKQLNSDQQFPVIIYSKSTVDLDVPIQTKLYDLMTSRLSLSQIMTLSESPDINFIELSKSSSVLLDVSAVDFDIVPVWDGDLGTSFEGENVIVGIYDTGIDFKHPDFIDEDGKSRILYLWDQTDDQGPNPTGFDYYGTEYLQSDINDEIDGTPTGNVQQKDLHGHGTHVAGIAAGNGNGSGEGGSIYKGMAPYADLIIVKGGDGVFDNSQIIDGLNYMFQRAQTLDRPIVINLSLGSQEGPHDGTSAIEKAINNFLWDPSRAVVVAAGNSGNDKIHASIELTEEQNVKSLFFDVSDNSFDENDYVNFDIWYSGSQEIDFTIRTSTDEIIGPVSTGSQETWPNKAKRMVIVDNAYGGVSPQNGDNHLWLQLSDIRGNLTDDFPSGEWELTFNGEPGNIHCWIYETSETISAEFIEDYAEQSYLVASPGNSNFAITVGAYVTRTSHPNLNIGKTSLSIEGVDELASFSSPGPTRTGGAKPEMAAPGSKIVAALSADVSSWPGNANVTTDSLYRGWQGTSMSAPHVAGLVALMFEADPSQNSSNIKTKLIQTCRTDEFTGDVWNASWGYGKVDAKAAIQNYTHVEKSNDYSDPELFHLTNYPNPFNGSTTVSIKINDTNCKHIPIKFYNIAGQQVKSVNLPIQNNKQIEYHWDATNQLGQQLPAGVYICHIQTQSTLLIKKMIFLP